MQFLCTPMSSLIFSFYSLLFSQSAQNCCAPIPGQTAPQLTLCKPNDPYRGRTAPLTSKRCILYIYSTNIGTEYFKHGIYSPVFSLQNAVSFIFLKFLVPVLFTFSVQGMLKLKNNSGAKRLKSVSTKF